MSKIITLLAKAFVPISIGGTLACLTTSLYSFFQNEFTDGCMFLLITFVWCFAGLVSIWWLPEQKDENNI